MVLCIAALSVFSTTYIPASAVTTFIRTADGTAVHNIKCFQSFVRLSIGDSDSRSHLSRPGGVR